MSGRRAPSGEAASRAPAGRPAAAASSRSRVRSGFGKRCVMMRKVSSVRFCRYKYRQMLFGPGLCKTAAGYSKTSV